ncbi:hypothetical protein [Flavobacterium psychrotolerans]|uniref:Uncharacterized protein n=1 Tax=Flavobacterium psychrotolerans TaxID=2169410 RepID=A0A2U1JPG8_9FLAO|nr:hypothetical protein [Flavobacterium psychrotolerans]PWA06874.1 hypothetical protein DB895_02510 [Flavobacterium psychrotolerans]
MKAKVILVSLFLSVAFLSCKNEAKKEEIQPVEEVKANTFDVVLDLNIKKDDELILFYKDASISYFDEDHTVYAGVKGNEQSQKVIFNIPEGVLPNDIRLDISSNKKQDPIKINSIELNFEGRTFRIDQNNFEKYFKPNDFIKYDASSSSITMSEKDGNYDPFFTTNPAIYAELEKVGGKKL